jgi:predicted GIY-YIG superfamily endonuclease
MDPNLNTNLIKFFDDEPRVSHRIIAKYTENSQVSIRKLIDKHKEKLELFGILEFEMTIQKTVGGKQKVKTFYLNEQQANLLFVLMKLSVELSVLFIQSNSSFKALEEYSKVKGHFKKAFVYIIQFDNRNLKIGFSSNPSTRLRSLETQSGNLIKNRLLLKFNSKKEALVQEKKLHQQFHKFRTHGEYFDISFEEVIKQI